MPNDAAEQQQSAAAALKHADLTLDELWVRYFALGGNAGLVEVDAYLHGLNGLDRAQRDVLAHAVNERLDELTPPRRAGYSRHARADRSRADSLEALVGLLEGAELAPPERLPALLDGAAGLLGVRVAVLLADKEERSLHPWSADGTRGGPTLDLDTTPAGCAFRELRVLPVESDGRLLLWVPLLDGAERLGVLRVEVDDPADLYDPELRARCRWLAMLVGHLVTLLGRYGDAADLVRSPGPHAPAGELASALLPPPTAGVDRFVVTAAGNAYDYALSDRTASFVVLDAGGHDSRGLVVATALATHRSARREGLGLADRVCAVDEAVRRTFGPTTTVTAVFAEVDLTTGGLVHLVAGHPAPLVVRAGRRVDVLGAGSAPALGTGLRHLTPAEDLLGHEDWLVLRTAGTTAARDERGEPFGEARFAESLLGEAAAGRPPVEVVRRLVRAISGHAASREEVTLVLTMWTDPRRITP
ncbi:PP2C family protein-serine/threonine phosphatase [Actinosynnema sp. NPDC047251]|uniref:PPM-type phosphatase domain-containing protein n=1 Tax=Saccharothrix espanaensis (strain ATCC 51144 / DSM 44229 / JCM 9112 / NBRC 15066 / NRRL 15764) TaxID=1179773 RepID=K0JUA9_SACES|nr:PP2C family protein-serine/threonine phosphatase [Saccharothrix espanaensis]CCH29511.1 hypothetical protein BN6_21890 [Saccharothrix espanaensis DSM 44229]